MEEGVREGKVGKGENGKEGTLQKGNRAITKPRKNETAKEMGNDARLLVTFCLRSLSGFRSFGVS